MKSMQQQGSCPLNERQCPSCKGLYSICVDSGEICTYCPHCNSMIDPNKKNLNQQGKYRFDFTSHAWFALIGERAQEEWGTNEEERNFLFPSFWKEIQPVVERMLGHLGWIVFFGLGLFFLGLGEDWIQDWGGARGFYFLTCICMGGVFLSCCFLGSYWSDLMMGGAFMPWLMPPSWERICRFCQKGKMKKARSLVEKKAPCHPGAWANLALGYWQKGEAISAWESLEKALERCPSHPALLELACMMAPEEQREDWERQKEKMRKEQKFMLVGTNKS